ncbi:MAG: hypothetical protein IIC06_05355 [Proteobacteria bacterium]|nr:hypothetical protein [Pseudomonadota bacterium]
MNQKNMAMFEEAMKVFAPFHAGNGSAKKPAAKKEAAADSPEAPDDQLDDLRSQLQQMQRQLDKLTRDGKG